MSAKFQYVVLALVALVGCILILIGFLTKNPNATNILFSIGTSVLATAIVSSLIRLSLGDPTDTMIDRIQKTQDELEKVIVNNVRIIDRASHTGLVSVWTARQEVPTNIWIDHLRHASSEIKLLAYAMAFLPDHPEFVDILDERINAGCKVYMSLGDPKSQSVASREVEENENIIPRIETTINRTRRLIGRKGFHLRTHDVPLYCSVFLFDDDLFVTPHLYGLRGAGAPLFHFKRTPKGLFGKYEKHFDDVWRTGQELTGCGKMRRDARNFPAAV